MSKNSSVMPLFHVPQGCPDIFPFTEDRNRQLLKTETCFYCTIADGRKRVFTDHDRLQEYDSSIILDPDQVSLINLYINGMIQLPILYEVTRGMLRLKTADIPKEGVIIVLQFIKLFGIQAR